MGKLWKYKTKKRIEKNPVRLLLTIEENIQMQLLSRILATLGKPHCFETMIVHLILLSLPDISSHDSMQA